MAYSKLQQEMIAKSAAKKAARIAVEKKNGATPKSSAPKTKGEQLGSIAAKKNMALKKAGLKGADVTLTLKNPVVPRRQTGKQTVVRTIDKGLPYKPGINGRYEFGDPSQMSYAPPIANASTDYSGLGYAAALAGLGYGAYKAAPYVKNMFNNLTPTTSIGRVPYPQYVAPATRGVQQVVGTVINGPKAIPLKQFSLRTPIPGLGFAIPTPMGGVSLFGGGRPMQGYDPNTNTYNY